jgi:penicillin-insensitive murein endopeptidase
VAAAVAGAIAVAVSLAGPARGDDTTTDSAVTAGRVSGASVRSIGWVWRGLLRHGVRLEESAHVRHVERFVPGGRFFGTPELVGLLERAAERVWSAHPGARLSIGELSQEGGGNVPGHRSHENGRDVDLGFYLREEDGTPVEAPAFVRVWGSGAAGFEGRQVFFDTARNWALVQALITDEETHVQQIFVAWHVRRRLIRWARGLRLDRELIDRADRMMLPPEGVARHDDHFHVRIYCAPRDQATCDDRGPFWAWVPPEHLPEGADLLPRHYRPAEGAYVPHDD